MPQNYEEKRQARIDRFRDRAEAAQENSGNLLRRARTMASVIPFGQPILVGHHSEKRDRNYRERIHNTYGQAFKEGERADYWNQKAAAAESNTAISSDDPEAITKLEDKIRSAQESQELMKAANKIIKKKKLADAEKIAQLAALGFPEKVAAELLKPDFCGRIGFASYQLQNNNANIRRMQQRLDQLKAAAQAEHKETEYNGFKVVENIEENRVQFFFDEKPKAEIREVLKRNAFKFSKWNGNAWQRFLNPRGIHTAYSVAKEIEKLL